jgi:hypothetical protein
MTQSSKIFPTDKKTTNGFSNLALSVGHFIIRWRFKFFKGQRFFD